MAPSGTISRLGLAAHHLSASTATLPSSSAGLAAQMGS